MPVTFDAIRFQHLPVTFDITFDAWVYHCISHVIGVESKLDTFTKEFFRIRMWKLIDFYGEKSKKVKQLGLLMEKGKIAPRPQDAKEEES